MHAGAWGEAGTLFAIDVSDGESKTSIKRKLAGPTGIPVEAQKIMLGAFCQAREAAHGSTRARQRSSQAERPLTLCASSLTLRARSLADNGR
jgi:hypothetical protein